MITYNEIKDIKHECEQLCSNPDWREVTENIATVEPDFWVDNVRYIHSDAISEVLADELSSDLYILGCFNANFLASVCDIDIEVVQALQEAEAFEALGKLVLPHINEIANEYACIDGYGHHFNSYDFGEEELTVIVNGITETYHVFDNR